MASIPGEDGCVYFNSSVYACVITDKNVDWWYSCTGPVAPDRDVYYDLAKQLFGEQKISTHPVPEYMEVGEIPRYSMYKTHPRH